jgi:hypothetical protein
MLWRIFSLENLQRYSLEDYLADLMVQGWTERLFQVGIECCIDILKVSEP